MYALFDPQAFLGRLRAASQPMHDRLDAMIDPGGLTSRQAYRDFLLANYPALAGAENGLESGGVEMSFPDWSTRRRSEALAADLSDMGVGWRTLPPPHHAPVAYGRAAQTGQLYVLEGSRLGAAHILHRMAASGGGLPTRFLRHGQHEGHWRSFQKRVAEFDISAAEANEAESAAKMIFGLFVTAFERVYAGEKVAR
ncbi:MAG: biliverdin-producing heme oxygenase [Beijerinckiaceae bacterium]